MLQIFKQFPVLFIILMANIATNAHAVDYKVHSGAMCQSYYGNLEGDLQKRYDGIYNVSTGYRWVNCAFTRDDADNTNGTAGVWAYLSQSSSSTSYCYFRTVGYTGSTTFVSSTPVTGSKWVSFNSNTSKTWDSYLLYCNLAPNAKISTVILSEHGPTDNE